jgi:hypothetical protein
MSEGVTTLVRTMGSHQSAAMCSDVWLTPPEILDALGPFNLDPCAAPEPRPWPTAHLHYWTPRHNGLLEPWSGRVWLNPPYSREAVRWLQRMAAHGNGIALTFARTETTWFFETVWHAASAILFLEGRLHFHQQNGRRAEANAGAPSVLVACGEVNAAVLEHCGLPGYFVPLSPERRTP